MLTQNISLGSIARAGAFALVAAVAMAATEPAAAASLEGPSIRHLGTVSATDISAARRQQTRRSAPRSAYGSYVGGAGGSATPSAPAYGYGYGDNSHGQTW